MKSCDQEKQLTAYLLGELSGQEAAAVQQHLEQCPECRASLLLLQPAVTTLQQALARDGAAPLALSGRRRDALLTVRPDVRRRVTLWLRAYAPVMSAVASLFVVLCAIKLIPSWPGMVSPYRVPCGTGEPATVDIAKVIKFKKKNPRKVLVNSSQNSLSFYVPEVAEASDEKYQEPEEQSEVAQVQQELVSEELAGRPAFAYGFDTVVTDRRKDAADSSLAPVAALTAGEGDHFTIQDPPPSPALPTFARQAGLMGAGSAKSANPPSDPATDETIADGTSTLPMKDLYSNRTAGGRKGGMGSPDTSTEQPRGGFPSASPPATKQKLETERKNAISPPKELVSEVEKESRETYVAEPQRIMNTLGTSKSGVMAKGGKGTDGRENGRAKQAQQSAQPPAPVVEKMIGGGCDALESPRVLPATPLPPPAKAPPPPPPPEPAQAPVATRTAAGVNPFVATATERFSTFALDVDTASYTLTRQAIRNGRLPEPEVVRTEEFVNAFDYGDSAPDRATFRVYVEGAPSLFGPDLTLLRIGVKGRRLGREEQRPAMLTFLLDTSGSMSQPDRIGMARTALKLLLANLSPADQVQLVAYNDRARIVLAATPASQATAILAAFDTLQCNGSTNLEDGMRTAYQQAARAFRPGGENRVILVSDGVANLGAGEAPEILSRIDAYRRQGITCSVFGVGQGTYNDKLLEQLANQGDGVYRFLDSEEEAQRVFVTELAATLQTIASDVKIQVEWNPEVVNRYRQLGYENRALKKEQFRDDTVDAGEVGSGESVSALYELDLQAGHPPRRSLGTVRIRYRRADNRAIEEIATPITAEMISKTMEATRPQFKLAAGVAEFAEILRMSPYAAGSRCEDVARLLRPVAQALPLDTRVQELVELVTQADALLR
jgi:Ca-activated chloride channel family protein